MSGTSLVSVEGVGKKFCRSLRRSVMLGMQDIAADILGLNLKSHELRQGEFWAVENVSFSLKRGECLGLIGPNGSGKSTLLKLLSGIILPDRGAIRTTGTVGTLIEIGAGFHPLLTGRENVYLYASILGLSKKEIDKKFDEIVSYAELESFIDTPVRYYSNGMYVRLAFSVAVHVDPDILLLDEVLAVGDLGFRTKCLNTIAEIQKKAAIVIVSHQVSHISRMCTQVAVLEKGSCIYHGTDVAAGIDKYFGQFSEEVGSVSGNGQAEIHEVELSSPANSSPGDRLAIVPGSNLHVRVEYSLDKNVKEAVMSVTIIDRNMNNVLQSFSSNGDHKILNSGRRMYTKLVLKDLSLNPGRYFIQVAFMDKNLHATFVKWYCVKSFQVSGTFFGFAPVQEIGLWETS